MKALYVGILTNGTTSRMRASALAGIESSYHWDYCDTDERFRNSRRVWKTLAFRARVGPLVNEVNDAILKKLTNRKYDLIWVDKGVYLKEEIIRTMRAASDRLVHFTPDTAFYANSSRYFERSIPYYDLLVTTKVFEVSEYTKYVSESKVYLTTQAYDAELHGAAHVAQGKKSDVAFIGLYEPDRGDCIETLLSAGISVRLGGKGWGRFMKRHRSNSLLNFSGERVFGEAYTEEYLLARVGLGLLTRRFPEMHTTRTFEIPAMGVALATERNQETQSFFDNEDVIFFSNYNELARKLVELRDTPGNLAEIAQRGQRRVFHGRFDNVSVLTGILERISK